MIKKNINNNTDDNNSNNNTNDDNPKDINIETWLLNSYIYEK